MSTVTTTTFWATHSSRWDQLKFGISEWQRRTRSPHARATAKEPHQPER